MENIVIIGSEGHAKVVIDIVEREEKYAIAGLIDLKRQRSDRTLGHKILGSDDELPRLVESHGLKGAIVAIGDNFLRSEVAARVRDQCPELPFVRAIHPGASVGKDVSIGEGSVLMAGAIINPSCVIGRFCILNTNASLDHDSRMDDFSSLAPRVATGGNCRLGVFSAMGIGAILVHGTQVAEHTVIGAGAVVLDNIEAFKVAHGTPAKAVRDRKPGDKYL